MRDQDYEVEYFAEKYGLRPQQVRDLIARFGNSREELERKAPKTPRKPLMPLPTVRGLTTAALLIAFAVFLYACHGLREAYGRGYQAARPIHLLGMSNAFPSNAPRCLRGIMAIVGADRCRLT